MTDPVIGGIGVGLVWGWWLVIVASPSQAHTRHAAAVLGSSTFVFGVGIYLLAGTPSLVAATLAALAGCHVAFKGALRQRRHVDA